MSVSDDTAGSGFDANDAAAAYGDESVKAALERRASSLPPIAPYDDEAVIIDTGTFELLDIDALENMPPPAWLVHEAISDDGLSIIYGEPGAGKSFIALDMALRVALGADWHGIATKRAAVLYIAGEGARGIGKRITGWKRKRGVYDLCAPFVVLPMAVQILDPGERAKLIRTIDEAVRLLDAPVGLVVVDTVSRSLAGADENGQETMTQFVAACDEIKRHAGGALIGIHHSGKDKDRGMRGSSVLLGAVDASIRLSKSEKIVTLQFEKQKDAEEAAPIYFELEKVSWSTGTPDEPGEDQSTLVPVRLGRGPDVTEGVTRDMIARAFGMMADAWGEGNPLSSMPQTRRFGRFAPAIFASKIGGEARAWEALLDAWLAAGAVVFAEVDSHSKTKGLKVLEAIV